jgi:hypothetical protein
VTLDELPPDPDLDAIDPDIAAAIDGPLTISGVDEDGNVYSAPVAIEHVAAALADVCRARELDE